MNTKSGLTFLIRTAVLLALAVAFQSLGLNQWVTGPVVNAILGVASISTGWTSGVLVGLFTPWVALTMGIMKFAPAVPVIIAGNIIYSLVFSLPYRFNKFFAGAAAAVAKFAVMTAGMKFIVAKNAKVPAPVMASLTVTQLYTALIGSAVALLVLASLERAGFLGSKKSHDS
ncbi:MAG TPA: ECF transporter S component [Firmicutes bacterium]|nr:ECF transporter S component [Bacillota bacterium]